MLGKLMKYEFKATGRMLLPLYAALLGFAIINKIFIGTNFNETNIEFLGGIPAVITMIGYVVTMIAVFVGTFIITLQRFYKNLIGDEGYLMHTIPVKSWQNILNKLLVSMIWTIVSVVVAGISIAIMAYEPEAFKLMGGEFGRLIKELYSKYGIDVSVISIQLIVLGIVSLAHQITMFYAALSIGQLFKSKKILGSFAGFMIISIAQQAIVGICATIVGNNLNFSYVSPQQVFFSAIAISLLFLIALFFITNYILKNKLNLE